MTTSAFDHGQPILAQGERNQEYPVIIYDIDEFDKNNELALVEYVEELYMLYKLRETESRFRDYRSYQPYINATLRARLLDRLIEVHDINGLMPETLYLAINIVDRYLSVTPYIARINLNLIGIAALLISSKYEEISPLPVDEAEYPRDHVLAMEKAILNQLNWYLSFPTPYVFAVRYAKASLPSNKVMEDLVFFFTELGLMDYSIAVRNNPSKLAASAVYAARCTLNMTPLWTETLKHYTGYTEDQVSDCGKLLVSFDACASKHKLTAVYKKYLNPHRNAVRVSLLSSEGASMNYQIR